MLQRLSSFYLFFATQKPQLTLALLALVVVFAIAQTQHFQLDASADSLTLEADEDVAYYRESRALFPSSDDFLVIAVTSEGGVFDPAVIEMIASLKSDLESVAGIKTINSILNVPLLHHPDLSLTQVEPHLLTFADERTTPEASQQELLENPLYRNLLISDDGMMTALQLVLKSHPEFDALIEARESLRVLRSRGELDAVQQDRLTTLDRQIREMSPKLVEEDRGYITQIREIMQKYQGKATLYLGGGSP